MLEWVEEEKGLGALSQNELLRKVRVSDYGGHDDYADNDDDYSYEYDDYEGCNGLSQIKLLSKIGVFEWLSLFTFWTHPTQCNSSNSTQFTQFKHVDMSTQLN